MSEALTRLASRALGLSGTVRPRPASRFSDGGMDQPLPDFAGEPLVAAGQAAPQRAMPSRSPANAHHSFPLAAGDPVSAPQAAPEGEPVASRLMAQPTTLPDATPSRRAPLPADAALSENPPRAAEAAARIEAAPPSLDRVDPDPFSPASTETAPAPYRPLLPIRADHAAPPAHASPAAPPPAPPDIQISIGRIEVRAEKPEPRRPPAAPPRARPALMSLDDYLARGRGRR